MFGQWELSWFNWQKENHHI